LASGFKDRNSARSKLNVEGFYNFSEHWFPCVFHDLSVEGAGIKINQTFVPGDLIRLKLVFRGAESSFEATVANVNGTRIGVKFLVDSATQEFLKNLIQANQRPVNFRRQS